MFSKIFYYLLKIQVLFFKDRKNKLEIIFCILYLPCCWSDEYKLYLWFIYLFFFHFEDNTISLLHSEDYFVFLLPSKGINWFYFAFWRQHCISVAFWMISLSFCCILKFWRHQFILFYLLKTTPFPCCLLRIGMDIPL